MHKNINLSYNTLYIKYSITTFWKLKNQKFTRKDWIDLFWIFQTETDNCD